MRKRFEFWSGENGICLLEGWARRGMDEQEVAKKIGISMKTMGVWKKKEPAIKEVLDRSSEVVEMDVERALVNKALGGDVRACIFWLRGRKKGVWNDREVELIDVEAEIEKLLGEGKEGRKME